MQTDRMFEIQEISSYPREPHFVDERTLLSARPVVPLEDIEARVRHRRRLALTGALAIAVLFGACAALLIAHLEQRPIESPVTASSQPAEPPADESKPAQVETVSSVIENDPASHSPNDPSLVVDNKPEQATGGISSTAVAASKRPLPRAEARLSKNSSKASAVVGESDDEETMQALSDQHARRLERWEERRLRREISRDRRAIDRDSGDGLFRVREIFEGPGRPH